MKCRDAKPRSPAPRELFAPLLAAALLSGLVAIHDGAAARHKQLLSIRIDNDGTAILPFV